MAHDISREREIEICNIWNDQVRAGQESKERYRRDAREAERYYAGPNHDFMFSDYGYEPPEFKVTVNKVYELVSIFGPMLYAQNPTRLATPRPGGNPIIAECQNRYLNYTPGEFGLKSSAKAALDEAMIHGRGVMMTGVDRRTGLVMSQHVHDKDILIDPSDPVWYKGLYILRLRRNVPLWKVAQRFGKDVARRFLENEGDGPGLAGEGSKLWDKGGTYDNREYDREGASGREQQQIEDFAGPRITYIEVFSKMGVGTRAKRDVQNEASLGGAPGDEDDNVAFAYEPSRKILLSPPGRWPIIYWADHGKHSWPFSFIDPAENQDRTWPISMITPALGLQKFLDWGWSFALSGIKRSVRNIAIAPADLTAKIVAALKGNDTDVIIPTDLNDEQRKNLVSQIEMMPLNMTLLEILREALILFEKATGLYEMLYGQSSRQIRSATEATVKAEFSRLRIDDVVDRVEDWHAEIARKEALGARYLIDPEQMVPIMGEEHAAAWGFYRPGNFEEAVAEYDYTIQAGSMRKRTPQYRVEISEKALGILGQNMLAVGDLEGYNALVREWLTANGVHNPERFLLKAVPPPEEKGQQPQQEEAPPVAPEVLEVADGQPIVGAPEGVL